MVRLTEPIVAHLAPCDQVERLGESPQAQDFQHIHLAGHIHVWWQTFRPAIAPFGAQHFLHLFP